MEWRKGQGLYDHLHIKIDGEPRLQISVSPTRRLVRVFDRNDELEAVHCELSIATFRYAPSETPDWVEDRAAWLDALNAELLELLKASGELFVSNAMTDGRFLLRACIVNFRTALEDVEALPEIVLRHARELKALKEL